jgi:glycolate oxidase FAD binding subunit
MSDPILSEWQGRIRTAVASGRPLVIRGGGTKDFYGACAVDSTGAADRLLTTAYAGIVDYDPTELVITARAGTALADVERTMRDAGQMLGFEPPHFGAGATLGGAIAAGLSGPRRPYAGAVRDFVLGVRVIDGRGDDLTFGGRVMKNVAGFDVARLMTGALGTLGIVAEVSLKCLPLPQATATRVFDCGADEAIRRINEWGGKPLPLSATCWHEGRLAVRLSGAEPAVTAAIGRLGGVPMADDTAFWSTVREQTHSFFAAVAGSGVGRPAESGGAAPALWRLSVRSTAPFSDLGGDQLVEWGGALRWVAGARSDPAKLRAWAQSHGGHATLFRAGDKSVGAFQPLSAPLEAIHRRLKASFDPAGVFNRGRLHAAF